ncbi:hypothetical protein [Acidovorax sp. SDU_ACID1]|uniref:hypothetical protein n=1 Tax=Acidovorax sp. SDU_ACID1 TaxID=3136632 RepID=UPI003872B56E
MNGNSATAAVHTGSVAVNDYIGGNFRFPISGAVPESSVVNSIAIGWHLNPNVANAREFAFVRVISPGGPDGLFGASLMAPVGGAWQSSSITSGELNSRDFTTERIRSPSASWEFVFASKSVASVQSRWAHAYLDIDYTPATLSALFFGENF